jgi:hypothetical protein
MAHEIRSLILEWSGLSRAKSNDDVTGCIVA